jgi:hypothetical protein
MTGILKLPECCLRGVVVLLVCSCPALAATNGVFVRFQLDAPTNVTWRVDLRLVIHEDPWQVNLPTLPAGVGGHSAKRLPGGAFTEWLDLKQAAGAKLHGRNDRAGGIAEFPCLWATFEASTNAPARQWRAELATAPDEQQVVRRFEQKPGETPFGFIVTPDPARDKADLETVAEMAARHRAWARAATGGKRVTPERLILQTQFWGVYPPDDVEAVWLLGFNHVGMSPAVLNKFPFRQPAGHHWVEFGPEQTRAQLDRQIRPYASNTVAAAYPAVFGFADEVACHAKIGTNAVARAHFHQWLAEQGVAPAELGAGQLSEAIPIETPDDWRERQKSNTKAANRIFYYTTRFRQASGTQHMRDLTESFHRWATATNALTTTLVADHPYFSGTGLGMGMDQPNMAWGGWPLALDWFALARNKAVDLIGIEDWMGLQYMYGPRYTWEGPQLMGFQATMMRSGSEGTLPIIAWITPSDETNFLLKATSALAQGAKHLFFWTYGPTCSGTENYWSDLRGAYDGVARYARQLAATERIIAPGTTRPTRVALVYSISSDLWQPFGYIHMLERRGTYLSLVHDQYLVDLLTEQDVEAGRLNGYDALYVTDACLTEKSATAIVSWVRNGGRLYGACGAGSRNEFNEPAPGLAEAFGIAPAIRTTVQPGEYRVRGKLNGMNYQDQVRLDDNAGAFGALGVKAAIQPTTGGLFGRFQDGTPAAVTNTLGKGQAIYFATCPALAYIKEAKFVPAELKEKWPSAQRQLINRTVALANVPRLVELDQPVVEAGLYDAEAGTALVLANFTHEPIRKITVRVPVKQKIKSVRACEAGRLRFTLTPASERLARDGYPWLAEFSMPLGINDVVLLECGR